MSEYWIQGRCVVGADSNIDDLGHAGHVRDHYRSAINRYIRDDGSDGYEGDFNESAIEGWLHEHEACADGEQDDYDDPVNAFLDYHSKTQRLPAWADDYEQFEFAVFAALGSNSDVRCVEHAIEKLRWIRVLGNNVQCWDYSQLHEIVEGLWEIDSEGNETDHYYVEVLSCGDFHECALKDIEALIQQPA